MKKSILKRYCFTLINIPGVIVILAAFNYCQSPIVQENEKPNIIFLLTDDQRWDALGVMGNNIIKTPHLDHLARNGIMFRNAYVTTSICCVSRASILGGQYESRHNINDFSTSFSPEALENTYPLLLKKSGYKIGFIGKYGVGNPIDQPKEKYDFWEGSEKGQPDYELTDEEGNYLHHTDKVSRDINRFLDQAGKNQQPFCLSVSFKAPHVQDDDPRQFIINPRYESYYKDAVIPIPETAAPVYWEQFPDFFRTDQNIARVRWKLRFATPEMYQESVKNYYRLLTDVDDAVGGMIKKLQEMGLDANTIIIFMGDNGFFLGEHGLAGKWFGHEESVRVPLIIYDPRKEIKERGKIPEQIALNIDIAPTILNLARAPVPEEMQGVDLIQMVDGKKELEREDFFYEHTFLGSPMIPKVEGVVRIDKKYMKFIEHDYEEFYDLKNDPLEKNNLINDHSYQEEIRKMRERYSELKEQVK
jgi:arylsulfatase A-like enzyme